MKFSPFSLPPHRLAAIAAALMLVAAPCAHAGPPPWGDVSYNYYADKATPLATVLREFAGSFSLTLDLSPQLTGSVNGRFQARTPTEFLNQLGGVYGFQWFTHAGTLFISRSNEIATSSINSSGARITAMRQALTSLGVLDARFGWGELPEQGLALVSGPPAYVDLVKRTIENLPLVAGGQQVAVFRLKHASVDDRTMTYRDRQITTKGLAQVLRDLVMGDSASVPGVNNDAVSRLAAPLRASGNPPSGPLRSVDSRMATAPALAGSVSLQSEDADVTREGSANLVASRRRMPSIQADSRLNALIIQDTPERLPMFKALIEQLDVPTALIEIEALIIDVNSTRLDELGIAWGGRKGGLAAGFGDVTSSTGALTISAAARNTGISTTSTVLDAGNYLVTRIRALEQMGEASIQSRPSILTLDNTGALLDLSETFYIRTSGERVATVTPVTVGTTLKVTPRFISPSGIGPTVQLDVDIEDGQIQDREVDNLPTVRRSTVSTQALVGENQTLLIGGYNTQYTTQANDRIPLLGAIPLVGALFSHKVNTLQARERLFLIKPRVVTLPDPEPALLPGGPVPRISAPPGRDPSEKTSPYQPTQPPDYPATLINPPPAPFQLVKPATPVQRAKPPQSFPASGEYDDGRLK
ncbi:type III secretion system outer membrane ring subunit SctC [Ottowia thiooxydans]|uniref:type III secretion system outer membrane ring subunit SctC n=1 Tax=Ottowia thiooxydans TaxID=219182 RepID=UPI00040D6572|nr:type III secretion system outer membrane ring subunit SctC [Ottowia thiooxydans]